MLYLIINSDSTKISQTPKPPLIQVPQPNFAAFSTNRASNQVCPNSNFCVNFCTLLGTYQRISNQGGGGGRPLIHSRARNLGARASSLTIHLNSKATSAGERRAAADFGYCQKMGIITPAASRSSRGWDIFAGVASIIKLHGQLKLLRPTKRI